MSALALDIGTYTIKALQAKPGKNLSVERAVEAFNKLGVAVPSDEAAAQKMIELLEALLSDHKLPRLDVRLSLPETVVSTKIISLPSLSDAELASAISWQAEQYIPIPPEQLSLEYQVIFRPERGNKEDKMRVLLVGAHKEIIERYLQIFLTLGIEPKLLETQILSVLRSLAIEANEPTTLIAHLGASSTQLAIIHQGELQFVTSHMVGGQMLTQTLEKQIQLNAEQAEQYKRTYGLNPAQFEGKVRAVLLPVVNVLLGEIKKAITFFVNQHPGVTVSRVLLSGGTALLPGLVQQITDEVGAEVLLAAPFAAAQGDIPEANHPQWTVCTGLLLREDF